MPRPGPPPGRSPLDTPTDPWPAAPVPSEFRSADRLVLVEPSDRMLEAARTLGARQIYCVTADEERARALTTQDGVLALTGTTGDLLRSIPLVADLLMAPDPDAASAPRDAALAALVPASGLSGGKDGWHEAGPLLWRRSSPEGGRAFGPDDDLFALLRAAVAGIQATATTAEDRATALATATAAWRHMARDRLARLPGNTAPWPLAAVAESRADALPDRMPDGRPWPRISIVTPSLNQGRFIEDCLLSVANQGYPDVEHIVVDGGSTDETLAVVAANRDRLAWFESEPDRGQSHAINKGMARATGRILTWLNADDQLAPGALAAVALAFATSGADMVAGVCEIWSDGRLERSHLTSCPDGPLPFDQLMDLDRWWLTGRFFYQPEVFFSRALWDRGGAHVREDLFYSMDWELWTRFARAGARLKVVGRPLARFRTHPDQKTHVPERYQTELRTLRDRMIAETPVPVSDAPTTRTVQSLRIALVNDVGFVDGAGIAHGRIAQALALGGHSIVPVALGERPVDAGADWPLAHAVILQALERAQPDLVIVGNLHGGRPSPVVLAAMAERWPTIFVLHDLWLLTGRCPYPQLCGGDRFLTGCDGDCPDPDSYPPLAPDRIADAWTEKRALLADVGNLVLAANSDWALGIVRQVMDTIPQAKAQAGRIRLGFPTTDLAPRDRDTCRRTLGLPTDRFVVFLTTTDLAEERKGAAALFEALRDLRLPHMLVVTVGRGDGVESFAGIPVRHFGYVNDPDRLACLFAAADLLVGPSSVETFGQIYVEAAACGTPAVAYGLSGVREAVADGVSGRLCPPGAATLAQAIQELHGSPRLRRAMGAWGRLRAENDWSLVSCLRSLHLLLEETGIAERLRLAVNIRILPDPPPVPAPIPLIQTTSPWTPRRNFGFEEGPFPDLGLPKFRWARGPSAAFDVAVPTEGAYRIALSVRNALAGQTLAVRQHDGVLGDWADLSDDIRKPQTLVFPARLAAGVNRLELVFGVWKPDQLDNAMVVVGVEVLPLDA